MATDKTITLKTEFTNITPALQADLEKLAWEHLEKFRNSYFKSILKKTDAQIKVRFLLAKNKQDKYEGKFHADLDGNVFNWENDVPFKEPIDVLNHSFKHLKESLTD